MGAQTNLLLQLTTFVGRQTERARVGELLASTRLITLTGAGGVGKTRLALQVALQPADDFADGVWLVELASLAEPSLVPAAVAAVLGVPEATARPLTEGLVDYFARATCCCCSTTASI